MCSIFDSETSCTFQPATISEVFQIQPPLDLTLIEHKLTRPDQRQEFLEASMQFLALILQKRRIQEPLPTPKRRPSRIHNVIRQFLETVKRTKSSKIDLINNNTIAANDKKTMKPLRRYRASSGLPMTSDGNDPRYSPLTFLFEQMALRPPPTPPSKSTRTLLKPSLSKLSVIDGVSRDSDDDSQFY